MSENLNKFWRNDNNILQYIYEKKNFELIFGIFSFHIALKKSLLHMGSSTEIATIKWYALFSSTE